MRARLNELLRRLDEPEEIVRAIRGGEVDAFVVPEPTGERIYSLRTGDVLYRAMVEDMKDGAVALDPSGIVLYCNAYFARLMKAERASIVGTRVLRFAPAASQPFFEALQERLGDRVRRQEVALRACDGSLVPVLATLNRIHLDGEQVFCLVVTNLRTKSERKSSSSRAGRRTSSSQCLRTSYAIHWRPSATPPKASAATSSTQIGSSGRATS